MSSGQHWVADQEALMATFKIGQRVRTRSGSLGVVTDLDHSRFDVVIRRAANALSERHSAGDLTIVPSDGDAGGDTRATDLKTLEKRIAVGEANIEAALERIMLLERRQNQTASTIEDAFHRIEALDTGAWASTVDARLARLEATNVLPEASLPEPEPDEDDRDVDACRACGLEWTATGRGCPVCAPRRGPEPVACPACGYDITPTCAKPAPARGHEITEPGVELALRSDRDAIAAILAKIRTILGTPDLADVVEQAERVVTERDAAVKAADRRPPDQPGLERSIASAQTPRHKELVATFGRGVGADVYIAELLTERDAAARDIAELRAARDAADSSELHECLSDLVRRAAREIKDRTLREALLADLEALLHPRKS